METEMQHKNIFVSFVFLRYVSPEMWVYFVISKSEHVAGLA